MTVVGLPDASVQEARERVRAAVRNSGCVFPLRRVTVNLAPADLKKEGNLSPTGYPSPTQEVGGVEKRPHVGTACTFPVDFLLHICPEWAVCQQRPRLR